MSVQLDLREVRHRSVEYAVDVCAYDCVFSSCLAVDCMYVHLAVIGDAYDIIE